MQETHTPAVAIVHAPEQLSRCQSIANLLKVFPSAQLQPAIRGFETDPMSRAVRGCSLAHLAAVTRLLRRNQPVIVLEDDALAYEKGLQALDLNTLPADADIVILGAETERHGCIQPGGWFQVFPRFAGSHAIMYMPSLLEKNWLLHAYALMASNPMGNAMSGQLGLCYESVMCMASEAAGAKMYRPAIMPFITEEGDSSRGGKCLGRTRNVELKTLHMPSLWLVKPGQWATPCIGKNACTSLKLAATELPEATSHDAIRTYVGYTEAEFLKAATPTTPKFRVWRDPVARCVSTFRFLQTHAHPDKNRGILFEFGEFDQFLNRVEDELNLTPEWQDEHIRRQCDWPDTEDTEWVDIKDLDTYFEVRGWGKLKHRNESNGVPKPNLSQHQIERIKRLYSADYALAATKNFFKPHIA